MSNNYDFSLKPQGPDPKNMLVAVLATSMIFMLYSYFFAPVPDAIVSEETNIAVIKKEPEVLIEKFVHEKATKENIVIEKNNFFHKEDSFRASYDVGISNQGASFTYYDLTDFKDNKVFDERSNFLNLYSRSSHITLNKDAVYEISNKTQDSITLRHVTKEGLEITRNWQFLALAQIKEEIIVKNISENPLKVELALDIIKVDEKKPAASFFNPGLSADNVVFKNKKHERVTFADLKKEAKEITDFSYLGLDEQFFLMAFIPLQHNINKTNVSVKDVNDKLDQLNINFELASSVLMPLEEQKLAYKLFIGPKQIDLLASVTPALDENIDFGWFGILSRPMLWMLVSINDCVHNYGLAIILITFIIKLLTYPLTRKSFTSQQEMKILAPKIKELQAKYSHDRTLLGQKQMELYKEHGINPLAGCLPLFIQFPVWIAFFQMLRNSVELYNQPFFAWITDLTLADPYFVLPVLMGASMFIQQYLTPMPQDQPQMKYVMWGMPFFITLVMLNMPAGLSLYSLVNNILTIAQQLLMTKLKNKTSN